MGYKGESRSAGDFLPKDQPGIEAFITNLYGLSKNDPESKFGQCLDLWADLMEDYQKEFEGKSQKNLFDTTYQQELRRRIRDITLDESGLDDSGISLLQPLVTKLQNILRRKNTPRSYQSTAEILRSIRERSIKSIRSDR